MRARPANAGFSLLEVLVATVLMGLVLVVLLKVFSTSLRAQEASQAHARALIVAEKVLGEYLSIREMKAGQYQGTEGRYAYRVSIDPQYELSDRNSEARLNCYLLQVTVFWKEAGRAKSLELKTIRTVAQKKS